MSGEADPRVRCPICAGSVHVLREDARCETCGESVPSIDGVFDLRKDPGIDTLLDVDAYDASHDVTKQYIRLASLYEELLLRGGLVPPVCSLEIGSGSGNLTYGLSRSPFFDTIFCSDISLNFMKLLQGRIQPDEHPGLRCFLLDANDLPFHSASFDCVLGHSVLHHLAHFENTLAEAYRVTVPEGLCIFGEPVLDVHAYASLLAADILRAEERKASSPLARKRILRYLVGKTRKKRDNLMGDRAELQNVEDKFQFSIGGMKALALSLGFRCCECISPSDNRSLGAKLRRVLETTFEACDEEIDFLSEYSSIFEDFDVYFAEPCGISSESPFSYFIFQK